MVRKLVKAAKTVQAARIAAAAAFEDAKDAKDKSVNAQWEAARDPNSATKQEAASEAVIIASAAMRFAKDLQVDSYDADHKYAAIAEILLEPSL